MNEQHSGIQGLVGTLLALLGLWAARHPGNPYVVLVTEHQGELRQVLTYALGIGGAVLTYVSHPPTWLRAWLAARWHDLKGFAKWGAITR